MGNRVTATAKIQDIKNELAMNSELVISETNVKFKYGCLIIIYKTMEFVFDYHAIKSFPNSSTGVGDNYCSIALEMDGRINIWKIICESEKSTKDLYEYLKSFPGRNGFTDRT
jgi:hypothetical protein